MAVFPSASAAVEGAVALQQRLHRRNRRAAHPLHVRIGTHHWANAMQVVDVEKAAAYAGRAGRQTLTQLAPDEAVRWFGRGLELLGARRGWTPASAASCCSGWETPSARSATRTSARRC
jgi:hypothetical protein